MYASFSQLDISYCSWSTGDQSSKEQVDREFLEEEAAVGLGFCVIIFFFFHAKDFGSVVVGSFLNLEAEPGTGSSSLCSGETQTSFENSALTLGLRDFSLLFRHNRRPPLNSGEAIVPPFKGFLAFLSRDVAAVTGLQAYRGLMMQPAKFSPKMDSVRTFVPFFTS